MSVYLLNYEFRLPAELRKLVEKYFFLTLDI
jgi:hypothetical protein